MRCIPCLISVMVMELILGHDKSLYLIEFKEIYFFKYLFRQADDAMFCVYLEV